MKKVFSELDPKREWLVESAGTWAQAGIASTPFSVQAMAAMGLDTSAHKSQPVTEELLNRFSLVLTMESGHKEAIQVEFPQAAGRVYMLSEMAGETAPVNDPIGNPYEEYVNTSKEIEDWITKGLPKILELIQ